MNHLNQDAISALKYLMSNLQIQIQELGKNKTKDGNVDPYFIATASGAGALISSVVYAETGSAEDMERLNWFENLARETREEVSKASFYGFDTFLRMKIRSAIDEAAKTEDDMKAIAEYMEMVGSARMLAIMTGKPEDAQLAKTVDALCHLALMKVSNGPDVKRKEKVTLD